MVELCKRLLLPLDDLRVVVREFVCPERPRSAVDRCLRRHGVARLVDSDVTSVEVRSCLLRFCFRDGSLLGQTLTTSEMQKT